MGKGLSRDDFGVREGLSGAALSGCLPALNKAAEEQNEHQGLDKGVHHQQSV